MSVDEFETHVNDALDAIPERLIALLENCIIVIEDEPPAGEPDLLGVYDGVPLTERDTQYGGVLPDRITIFRGPHLRMCKSLDALVDEIHITVVHEIAHHFGIDDDALDTLGYH